MCVCVRRLISRRMMKKKLLLHIKYFFLHHNSSIVNTRNVMLWGIPRGVEANVLDCDLVVSEFELKSRYSLSE